MRDTGNLNEGSRVDSGYVDLALEVIRRLAQLRTLGGEGLKEALIDKLFDVVKSDEAPDIDGAMQEFRAAHVSPEAIVIEYVPEVARRLGIAWEKDTLSFSVVTTGSVKLQQIVHRAALDYVADNSNEKTATTILLLVPAGEQHTLGSKAAAAWLRMKGVSVCLRIGPSPQELAEILQGRRFTGVFVSVGSDSKTEVCAKLVKTLRTLSKGTLPLVVGGSLADKKRDELMSVGADLVTTDLAGALEFVGSPRLGKHRKVS